MDSASRAARVLGIKDGFGAPGITLGASSMGLGVLAHSHGIGFTPATLSTFGAFSLSGQAAWIQGVAANAGLLTLGLAIAAANVRLLPLSAGVVAEIGQPKCGTPRWKSAIVALLTAATCWSAVMRRKHDVPPAALGTYALTVASVLWSSSVICTAAGWLLYGHLPWTVAAGLTFLTPLYFSVVCISSARSAAKLVAVCIGAGCALLPGLGENGLVLGGVLGGVACFVGHARRGSGK